MGKVAAPSVPKTVVEILQALNPRALPAEVAIYADAFAEYASAQSNIAEHGAVVFHPKTGAPIENPYLPIRDKAAAKMLRLALRSGDLWTRT